MSDQNHDALGELAGLYVLGALTADDRKAFEAHLAGCAECVAEVRTLSGVSGALPYAIPQIDPPFALRGRILKAAGAPDAFAVTPTRSSSSSSSSSSSPLSSSQPRAMNIAWLSAAAMLAVAVGLGVYAINLRGRIGGLELHLQDTMSRLERSEREVRTATQLAQTAQVRLAVLTSPDLKQMNLAGQRTAPRASGRAFFSSTGVLFAANELPPLPAGRTYQLWFLHGTGMPQSAGLLKPDAAGRVATGFETPTDVLAPTGFAVSIEPDGGVPQPTGDLYLVGSTQ